MSGNKNICYNNSEEEKYFKFLIEDNIKELEKLAEGDDILTEAFKNIKRINNDAILMSKQEEKELEDYCIRVGMKESYEDGRSEGLESGKMEKQLEIAKKMIEENADLEFIIKCTGLTREELEKLN